MPFPTPDTLHPVPLPDGTRHQGTVFLNAAIDHPRFEVGDYTYYSDHNPPEDVAARIAPYLYDFSPEKLVIGRFCQIASGVQFITASANHRYDGISTFPFAVFDPGDDPMARPSMPDPGRDTIIGNDVWIGTGALILPGAKIGSGVIIGAGSVVRGRVPDYAIVAGNPATVVRKRFSEADIARLIDIAWWDWPIETILTHEAAICGADVELLHAIAGKG